MGTGQTLVWSHGFFLRIDIVWWFRKNKVSDVEHGIITGVQHGIIPKLDSPVVSCG